MKTIPKMILMTLLGFVRIDAQQTSFQDSLLERMAGNWILTGDIAGQEVTHDIEASWILEHQYFQIHETSHEKDEDGTTAYEALILIGWDSKLDKNVCLWLDITAGGGLTPQAFGYGERIEDKIPFLFKADEESAFHTTFSYDRNTDTWQWIMDGEDNGKLQLFARLKLTRKE